MTLDVGSLIADISRLDSSNVGNDVDRAQAKAAIAAALYRLETPMETAWRLIWSETALVAALRVCVDLDLFAKWQKAGAGSKSGAQLAELAGADPMLIKRLLRHLAAMNAILETDEDAYAMTPFTAGFADPKFASLLRYDYDVNIPGFENLPSFLASVNYQNPLDMAASNWQHMKKTNDTFFEFLQKNPRATTDFQNTMTTYAAGKVSWTDIYPTEQLVLKSNHGKAIVVDIGGGVGHDLEKFRVKHPDLQAGSLILQDQPDVIASANVHESIEATSYDFFTEQPIKGARAYYMHMVLHDWNDEKALEILSNLRPAMEKGYSKILLHEAVIATRGPHPQPTATDLTMMMAFSAFERTEEMWRDLLQRGGFTVLKMWTTPAATEFVIEAELA